MDMILYTEENSFWNFVFEIFPPIFKNMALGFKLLSSLYVQLHLKFA